GDAEWAARVRAHRERRPAHWGTRETTDLAGTVRTATTPLLIDGLGTWLAAVFDEHHAWDGDRTPVDQRCGELVNAWRQAHGRVVAVSDEVGMSVVPATASGRAFRDALGRLNERLAAESEDVTLVVAGRPLPLWTRPAQAIPKRTKRPYKRPGHPAERSADRAPLPVTVEAPLSLQFREHPRGRQRTERAYQRPWRRST